MTGQLKMFFVLMAICLGTVGCSEPEAETSAVAPPVLRAEPSAEPEVLLPSELKRKLKANENAKFRRVGNDIVEAELFQSGIKSIAALKGLPLRFLDLGMTEVTDLSPIKGMPLKTLILENTTVADISVVEGMQLEILQLQNTKVTDLSPIAGMPIRELNLLAVPIENLNSVARLPLQTLWVPQTQVKDISPLKGKPMVSLDIQGTQVDSLQALEGMATLKRLNIADTTIADLTPLKGIQLQRITLTPQNIKTGMEILKAMPSLTEIKTSMQAPAQSAAQFWEKYDAGVWNEPVPVDAAMATEAKEAPSQTTPSVEGDTETGKSVDEESGEKSSENK